VQFGRTPLHVSAAKSDLKTMEVLVDGGAEIEALDSQGYPPMIGAVGVLSYEKVLCLYNHGASIDIKNETNMVTSLMASVSGQNIDMIKLCLSAGCNVHEIDKVIYSLKRWR